MKTQTEKFDMDKAVEKEFNKMLYDMIMKEGERRQSWRDKEDIVKTEEHYDLFKTTIDEWRNHYSITEWDCDAMRAVYALMIEARMDALDYLKRNDGDFEYVGVYRDKEEFAEEKINEQHINIPYFIIIDYGATADELESDYYYLDSEWGFYVFNTY